jgi:hypothetical protein
MLNLPVTNGNSFGDLSDALLVETIKVCAQLSVRGQPAPGGATTGDDSVALPNDVHTGDAGI